MPEEKVKIPRLGKAATEFNVSRETLVATLKKMNFEIEDNINTKLSAEMYNALLQEFAGEKEVLAEAKKIEIGTYSAISKQEPKAKTDKPASSEESEEGSLIIKNVNFVEPAEVEKEAPKAGPKILGKIELDTPKKKKEPSTEAKTDTPEPAPQAEEPTKSPAESPEKAQPEHVKTESPKLEGPKIIDKMDLNDLKPKKKSSKSSKTEKTPEPAAEEVVEEVVTEPEMAEEPEQPAEPERPDNFIETRIEKIQGPKIMGKIELPVEKPKESSKKDKHATAEDKKKKKRKRILKQNNGNIKQSAGKEDKKGKPEVEKVEISPEDIQRNQDAYRVHRQDQGCQTKKRETSAYS